MAIYARLRAIRCKNNLPAKELSRALGLKTEAAYYKKESGMIRFSLHEAKIIADLFGKPIEDIFFAQEVSCQETKATV